MRKINYKRGVIYRGWETPSLSELIKTRLSDAVRTQTKFLHMKPRDGVRASFVGLPNRSGQFEELYTTE